MTDSPPADHAIGVGMGGSCPECRAPVDLGQEFCLECGAPIRIRKGQRVTRSRAGATPAAAAAALAPPGPRGFPWVPFLAVLGLVTLGIVFALVDGGKASGGKKPATTDQGGVTELTTAKTTEAPETTEQTVTVPDCGTTGSTPGSSTPADSTTTPASPTTPASATSAGSTIPTVPASGDTGVNLNTPAITTPAESTPSTDGVVTVDQNGNLCPTGGATTPTSSVPTLGDSTGTGISTPSTTDTGSNTGADAQTWPASKSGFTIVLNSLQQGTYSKSDAEQRAAQAQSTGLSSGVLDSNEFSSLASNLWVVFSGIYTTESEADAALENARDEGFVGAYVRQVKP